MQITWWKVVAVVGVAALLFYGWNKFQDERQARIVAELQLTTQKSLNDSTEARLTVTAADRDSLSAAFAAEKALNGKLIAAVRIRVPKRDTILVHDTLPTQTTTDSTRVAEFHDSTFAGTIAGTVTAPPCCAPLGITYKLTRPAFAPTIAFIEVGGKTVATVSWQGESTQLEAPYARPQPKRMRTFGGWVEGNYRFVRGDPDLAKMSALELNGGVAIRLPKYFNLHAGVSTDATAFAGVRKDF